MEVALGIALVIALLATLTLVGGLIQLLFLAVPEARWPAAVLFAVIMFWVAADTGSAAFYAGAALLTGVAVHWAQTARPDTADALSLEARLRPGATPRG